MLAWHSNCLTVHVHVLVFFTVYMFIEPHQANIIRNLNERVKQLGKDLAYPKYEI